MIYKASLFVGVLLLAGCSRFPEVKFSIPQAETICTLQDSGVPLGEVNSLAFLNDSTFVVTARGVDKLYLFGTDGILKDTINHSGRASFEYLTPDIVRCEGGKITVWSKDLLKFIEYEADGIPAGEWNYPSACRDFRVTKDAIIIYTSGTRDDYVIDRLDKTTGKATEAGPKASWSHKALNVNGAVAPLHIQESTVYYLTRDALEIHAFDFEKGQDTVACVWDSSTFLRESVEEDIIPDYSRLIPYLQRNSLPVALIRPSGMFQVLAFEGDNTTDEKPGRFFTLYTPDSTFHFRLEEFAQYDRITTWKESFYFLSHSVREDDLYELRKMN